MTDLYHGIKNVLYILKEEDVIDQFSLRVREGKAAGATRMTEKSPL